MTIELNEQEANALLQLLDLANKAAGKSVARAVVHFEDKLNAAASKQQAQAQPEQKSE